MKKSKKKPMRIVGYYDTETTTTTDEETQVPVAFPVAYILNDQRDSTPSDYDAKDAGHVSIYRTAEEVVEHILDLVQYGIEHRIIPIIVAYNLWFDLITIAPLLEQAYPNVNVNAQSGANLYSWDLLDENDNIVLRMWDSYHLEKGGLSAMGATAGLAKRQGDWDYRLLRAPETPLTEEEVGYAERDTEVIPAYLQWLVSSNEWLDDEMLGSRVLTQTSLVRQLGKSQFGKLKRWTGYWRNPEQSIAYLHELTATRELPPDYPTYALRKACARGGLTLTAANYASTIQRNVVSIDVTSMHHAYITGRMVPCNFHRARFKSERVKVMNMVLDTTLAHVLELYRQPFPVALNGLFHFRNIRLKAGSTFARHGISILAESKFSSSIDAHGELPFDESAAALEQAIKDAGYHDVASDDAVFAFSKLTSASEAYINLTEVELWCVAQVYEWDSIEPTTDFEYTDRWYAPSDYVVLQSRSMFARKELVKHIVEQYDEGTPLEFADPNHYIPAGIGERIRKGTMEMGALKAYYGKTVKGQFNGLYGTQMRDPFRPDYKWVDGRCAVDESTVPNADNYDELLSELKKKKVKEHYNYGVRIVGGSRQHMVIAMMLLEMKLGNRYRITGGDTDSLKISLDDDLTADDLISSLEPLHRACRLSIRMIGGILNVDHELPLPSHMDGVGEFCIESATKTSTAYVEHLELWNKCRVSLDDHGEVHITAAGVTVSSSNEHNLARWIAQFMSQGNTFEQAASIAMGYGAELSHEVCRSLVKFSPKPGQRVVIDDFRDYLGESHPIDAPACIALLESTHVLGAPCAKGNAENIAYLKSIGRDVDTTPRVIGWDDNDNAYVVYNGDEYKYLV